MDFAKKILNKYGWKEGDGLGKNNDGISKPLKASLKFDNAGLGVDKAKEFNDHWWERCFNEAASNMDVSLQQDGSVAVGLKNSEDSVEISTKSYSVKKLKKAKQISSGSGMANYDNFLQSATLTKSGDEVLKDDRIAVEDIAVTQVKVLTDEELFRACGGRTAHKGARHGLKLSGKLARIEQQEREMLAKMRGNESSKIDEDNIELPKKKKRKNKDKEEESQCLKPVQETTNISDESVKRKRKKDRSEDTEEVVETIKTKKKKKKHNK